MHNSTGFSKNLNTCHNCDVLVAGGGIAGVCAAITAARQGANVLLVENFAVLGGNATSGGVNSFCGETAGQGEVFDEILSRLSSFDAIAPYKPYPESESRLFNSEILAFVLQEITLKANVKILFHSKICGAGGEAGRQIDHCVFAGASGLETIRAKQYIDTTGDGLLAHLAGFKTMKGRDSDQAQLPMSMMFFVRHANKETALPSDFMPDGYLDRINSYEELPMVSIWPNGEGSNAIKIKIHLGDSTDSNSRSEAEIRGRRKIIQVMDYFRRIEKKAWLLDHSASIIGIREGRRVLGEYVLTLKDIVEGKAFDDAIARGVFYLDGHSPDDDKRTYILPQDKLSVAPYQIPCRTLIAKEANNLLVAGRCFSAEQLALSSARVMPTCAMMGQAAGLCAALAAEKNTCLKNLDLLEIRKTLERRGAIL